MYIYIYIYIYISYLVVLVLVLVLLTITIQIMMAPIIAGLALTMALIAAGSAPPRNGFVGGKMLFIGFGAPPPHMYIYIYM